MFPQQRNNVPTGGRAPAIQYRTDARLEGYTEDTVWTSVKLENSKILNMSLLTDHDLYLFNEGSPHPPFTSISAHTVARWMEPLE